jgi:hypothetical protein
MGRPDWSQWRPYAWGGLVLAALAILLSRPYHSPWLGEGGPEEAPARRYAGGSSSGGLAPRDGSPAAASPGLAPPEPALVNALRHSYSGNAAPQPEGGQEALADAAGAGSAPGRANANLLSGLGGGASSGARLDAARAAAARAAAGGAGSASGGAAGSGSRAAPGQAAGPSAPDSAGPRASSAGSGTSSGGVAASRGGGASSGAASPSTGFAAGGGLGGEARGMGSGGGGGGAAGGDSGNGSFSPGGLSAAQGGAAPPDVKGGGAAGGAGGAGSAGDSGDSGGSAGGAGGSAPAAATASAGGAGDGGSSPFIPMGGAAGPKNQAPPEPINPEEGVPQSGAVVGQKMFARKRGEPPTIAMEEVVTSNGQRLYRWNSKMSIDADGAGDAWKSDRTGQGRTALRYGNGESLNPTTMPFIVKAGDQDQVQLGEYAAVSYKGKTVYAIVGDVGPKGVLGEGSIAVARALGIPSDPNKGGVEHGVQYLIFPGTRDAEPPRSAAAIQERGKALRARLGLELAAN